MRTQLGVERLAGGPAPGWACRLWGTRADPGCCVHTQLGVERLAGGPAPGWAWAQAPGAPAGDGALSAHSVAAMVENALRLEVRGT